MKKFVIKMCALTIVCSLLILGYCKIASIATKKYNGVNTADRITISFEEAINPKYNCYFLGNLRIYRGINPEKMNSVNAFNFAHDNDSYNQMYYKLLYLLDNDADVEYLVIGTDYFQFSFLSDTRNYVYYTLLQEEYRDDFSEGWIEKKEEQYKMLWVNEQNALLSCAKFLLNVKAPDKLNYQKVNGQYVSYGVSSEYDIIDRDYTILDIQLDYFRKIIALCEEEDIELYVIMPPLRENEVMSHTDEEREEFNNMIYDELKILNLKEDTIIIVLKMVILHIRILLMSPI